MTYEEEQKSLKIECERLQTEYDTLKAYFEAHPDRKKKPLGFGGDYTNRYILEKNAEANNIYDHYSDSDDYLYFRIISARLSRCKYKLTQSKTSRNVEKTMNFIGGITPQHVGGRRYKVEDGDGCGKFCLWFIVIDALIIFIWYLFSK